MLRLFLTVALSTLFLALTSLPAHAASVHIQVTPANLDTHPVGFQITARFVEKGVEYTVEIWRKSQMDELRFEKRVEGALVKVTRSEKEFRVQGRRNLPVPSIGSERIRYRFVATDVEVEELSFNVGFLAYTRNDKGEIQWMLSGDFYWFRLSDFQP